MYIKKNKHFFFISVCYCLCSLFCIGQNKEHNSTFSFSLSPTFPIGDFGNKSINNVNAGLAKTGSGSQLYFSHDFNKKIGICALIFPSSYNFDNEAAISGFQQIVGSSYNLTISSTKWKLVSYTVGAYDLYNLNKSKKGVISFFDRAMIGFANSNSPEIIVNGTNGSSSLLINQSSGNATSFCYLVGIGFRFNTYKRFSFTYSLDLFSTKTSSTVNIETNANGTITNKSTTINQKITTLPVSISFGYRFW